MARWKVSPVIRRGGGETGIRKRQRRVEQAFHIGVAKYLDAILMPLQTFWFHVPNGGARSPVEAGILKAMGVKAGMPDLVVWAVEDAVLCGVETSIHLICLIELKRPDGDGKQSPAQKERATDIGVLGLKVHVCETLEEVAQALIAERIPIKPHTIMGAGWMLKP